MATQKVISANAQKNNGATVVNGGNVASADDTNPVTIASLTFKSTQGPYVAVSPAESGNVGGKKIIAAGDFSKNAPMSEDDFIVRTLNNTTIAGQASTLLKSGASDHRRRPFHTAPKQEALGVTSINAFTGAVTYNTSKQGSGVPFVDPATGSYIDFEAFPTDAIPGELAYMVTGADATQDDYEKRTH